MITGVVFLILVASVPIFGGRLTRLGEVRLVAWWTLVASLVIQVVLIEVLAGAFGGVLAAAIHLASYGLAFMFVWYNRHIVGMGIMVAGGMLNVAAIAANGGVMPARLEALERAGIISDSVTFENSAPVENARLAFLGDIFAIPEGVPFANVFSIGDIVLVIGGGITVHTVSRSRLTRAGRADSSTVTEATPEPVVAADHPTVVVPAPTPVRAPESLAVRYERSQRALAERQARMGPPDAIGSPHAKAGELRRRESDAAR